MGNVIDTLSKYDIANRLLDDDNAAWSYRGAHALAGWLIDLADEMGEDIEFDRVALRCEWSDTLDPAQAVDDFTGEKNELTDDEAVEWFCERTTVIEFDGGILWQEF